MPEILPRFYSQLQKVRDAQNLARILLEIDAETHPDSNGRVYRQSADGHRSDRRRGTPIISRGVSGAVPGTDPLSALIRKEEPRRR